MHNLKHLLVHSKNDFLILRNHLVTCYNRPINKHIFKYKNNPHSFTTSFDFGNNKTLKTRSHTDLMGLSIKSVSSDYFLISSEKLINDFRSLVSFYRCYLNIPLFLVRNIKKNKQINSRTTLQQYINTFPGKI